VHRQADAAVTVVTGFATDAPSQSSDRRASRDSAQGQRWRRLDGESPTAASLTEASRTTPVVTLLWHSTATSLAVVCRLQSLQRHGLTPADPRLAL